MTLTNYCPYREILQCFNFEVTFNDMFRLNCHFAKMRYSALTQSLGDELASYFTCL